jgi:AraC family transcriptional regulator, transcriptional activator of pobA
MAAMTIRPLPLPEFHLLLRHPAADGVHKPTGDPVAVSRSDGFYLESTSDAVRAFGTGIPPTRFLFYFIGLVARSRATCTTGLASFEVGPRCAFFVPPEQIHSSRGWTTRDQGYALSFSEAFFVENLAEKSALRRSPLFQWDRPPFLILSPAADDALRALFTDLAAEWALRPHHSSVALRLILQLIVARLEHAAGSGPTAEASLDAGSRLYQRFRAALEKSFRTEKSPAAYAAQLGVHPNHLATAARAASGRPPGEWIRARIVLEAQCLLGNTTRTVKEIAAELGYADEAYFSRLFKKVVGVSPRDYQLGAS